MMVNLLGNLIPFRDEFIHEAGNERYQRSAVGNSREEVIRQRFVRLDLGLGLIAIFNNIVKYCMDIDIRRYVGIGLPANNNNTVIIIETSVVVLAIKDIVD